MDLLALNEFIVAAKSRTYIGDGNASPSCRRGSHDIGHASGRWRYLDSYFGGTDFAGQEVVWLDEVPVWTMNYCGRTVDPALIDAAAAGRVIKAALAHLYESEGRFLGEFDFEHPLGRYSDRSHGGCDHFTGRAFHRSGNHRGARAACLRARLSRRPYQALTGGSGRQTSTTLPSLSVTRRSMRAASS